MYEMNAIQVLEAARRGQLLFSPRGMESAGPVRIVGTETMAWRAVPSPAGNGKGVGIPKDVTDEDATAALRTVAEYVSAHPLEMYLPTRPPPLRGWLGRKTATNTCIIRKRLDAVLVSAGVAPPQMIAAWYDRGWIDSEARRTTRKVSIGLAADQTRPRCVCVFHAAWDAVAPDVDANSAEGLFS